MPWVPRTTSRRVTSRAGAVDEDGIEPALGDAKRRDADRGILTWQTDIAELIIVSQNDGAAAGMRH